MTRRPITTECDQPRLPGSAASFWRHPISDIDVFKTQMRRFGKQRKPFYVVLSKDDKALGASRFIAGGQDRLGAGSNTAELAKLGAGVIDLSDVKALGSTNHGKLAQLAEIAPQLESALAHGVHRSPSPGGAAQDAVAGSLDAVVTVPFQILGLPLRIITR